MKFLLYTGSKVYHQQKILGRFCPRHPAKQN